VSLTSQFEQALRHAVAPATLQIDEADDRVVCRVEELDSIGGAMLELRLETPRLASVSTDQLSKLGSELAAKLNYLMEPIAPIEVDADRCTMQLRSRPPRKSEASTSYFEVLVTAGGSIALVRYDKAKGARRERIPMLLTREVMARLVDDFDSAARRV
jgi:hypothetical protein